MLRRKRAVVSGFSSCRMKAEALARVFNTRVWPCLWIDRPAGGEMSGEDDQFYEASPSPIDEDDDFRSRGRDCSAATETGRAKLYELLQKHAVDDATEVYYDVSEHASDAGASSSKSGAGDSAAPTEEDAEDDSVKDGLVCDNQSCTMMCKVQNISDGSVHLSSRSKSELEVILDKPSETLSMKCFKNYNTISEINLESEMYSENSKYSNHSTEENNISSDQIKKSNDPFSGADYVHVASISPSFDLTTDILNVRESSYTSSNNECEKLLNSHSDKKDKYLIAENERSCICNIKERCRTDIVMSVCPRSNAFCDIDKNDVSICLSNSVPDSKRTDNQINAYDKCDDTIDDAVINNAYMAECDCHCSDTKITSSNSITINSVIAGQRGHQPDKKSENISIEVTKEFREHDVLECSTNLKDSTRLNVFQEERPVISRSTSLKTGKTPPGTPSRKKIVRFADVLGLDLEDVRHIISGDLPNIPSSAYNDLVIPEINKILPEAKVISVSHGQSGAWVSAVGIADVHSSLYPNFPIPGQQPDFLNKVRRQGICLESVLVSECNVQCTCRVMNWGYMKKVTARYTVDGWSSSTDIDASYISDSCQEGMDCFAFNLFLNSMHRNIQFALRYQVNGKEFWDSNEGMNYLLAYHGVGNIIHDSVPISPTWCHQFW